MVHEIAHNIGIGHEEGHKDKNCTNVPRWNECNRDDFEAFYQRHKDNWCMEEKEDACCDKEEANPGYEHLGCFNEDPANRLISRLMRTNSLGVTIKDCYREAINSAPGSTIFAVQDNQCFTTNDKSNDYEQNGKSKACQCNKGGRGSVSVYKVSKSVEPEFEAAGCWKDGWERGLPTLLRHDSEMTPTQCYDLAKKGPNFSHFAIQVNQLIL